MRQNVASLTPRVFHRTAQHAQPHKAAQLETNHQTLCPVFLWFCRMPDMKHNCKYSAVQKRIVLKYKWRHDSFFF